MTDKIKGYEHAVNYRLRFGSDAPSGQIVCGDCKLIVHATVMGKCGNCIEQNGGDEPSLSEGLDRVIHPVREHGNNATIPCTAGVTSSTSESIYTREELVLTITDSWEMQQEKMSPLTRWLAEDALDALIALGQVRVK